MATTSTLDQLPPELRSQIFENVFPESRTTVSFTAFCNLSTDNIDVYRMKSDDEVATPGTLTTLAKFNSRLPHAIHGPLAGEITHVFWKSVKIIINIFDEGQRNPFQEPSHLCPNFLDQAAGRLQHLVVKLYLTRAADSQALANPGFHNTFSSCHQDFEIKTFAAGEKDGRVSSLTVDSQQLLGITHRTAATPDLIMREDWCKDFLSAV